jgi:long-chain fatty acid transport protein
MKPTFRSLAAAVAVSGVSLLQAGGFFIQENNSLLGQAFAGRGVDNGNVSTMFTNPANMSSVQKHAVHAQLTGILPSAKFTQTGGAETGNNGGNGAKNALVPALYLLGKVNEKVRVGLGITSPWGLTTKWNDGWVGRFFAIRSSIQTININPSISYKMNDQWAFGVGVSLEYMKANLSKDIPFTANPQARVNISGQDYAMGANLGLIYSPWTSTRFGLSWRSEVSHNLKGHVVYTGVPAAVAAARSEFRTGAATAAMRTPDIFNLSASHDCNAQWTILADAMFTKWDVLRQISVFHKDANRFLTPERLNWKNTWMLSAGVNYKPSKNWVLRLGGAWDQSPTRNDTRSFRLPENDRVWASTGVDYNWSDCTTIKVSYAHLFVKKTTIDQTLAAATAVNASTVSGRVKGSVDLIGLHFTHRW